MEKNIFILAEEFDFMELTIIQSKIHEIRGYKIMFDFDLAEIYQVEMKVLSQTVKRNIERFPYDFMFQPTNQKLTNLRSQFATSSWGGSRYLPYAFTEHRSLNPFQVTKDKVFFELRQSSFCLPAFVHNTALCLGRLLWHI